MTSCIAMLRGINVGGKRVKMEKLRTLFEALGFAKARTYIQSGNVLFNSNTANESAIIARIEKQILADFGFAVQVFLRTEKEMADVIKRNPFTRDKTVDQSKLHVTFLSDDAPAAAAAVLETLAAKAERYHVSGREIFLHCPNGYGTSKLANPFIERKLRVSATTRNWKTANTLLALSADVEPPAGSSRKNVRP